MFMPINICYNLDCAAIIYCIYIFLTLVYISYLNNDDKFFIYLFNQANKKYKIQIFPLFPKTHSTAIHTRIMPHHLVLLFTLEGHRKGMRHGRQINNK